MSFWAWFWILLFLVLATVALFFWWRWQVRSRGMRAAVRVMGKQTGAGSVYRIPWVLLIGDSNDNASELCCGWRLEKAGGAGWYGQWWCSPEGGLLQVPAKLLLVKDGLDAAPSGWHRLLDTLLRIRSKRPLDAVVLHLSIAMLEADTDGAGFAVLHKKIAELQQRLGQSLPMYLVLTDCGRIEGFSSFHQALPEQSAEIPLGWSSRHALTTLYHSDWLDTAVDHVRQAVRRAVEELAPLQGELDKALYLLPERFSPLLPALRRLCNPIFRGNALNEAPVLRGMYFGDHTAFVARLFDDRVLAERGLAQPLNRILHFRQKGYLVSFIVGVAVLTIWLAMMFVAWGDRRQQAEAFGAEMARFENGLRFRQGGKNLGKGAFDSFWRVVRGVPVWEFESALFPLSLQSGADEKIKAKFEHVLRKGLFEPLTSRFNAYKIRLERQINRREDSDVLADPLSWPAYVALAELVADLEWLEHGGTHFYNLTHRGSGSLEEAAELGKTLNAEAVSVAGIRHRSWLDAAIREAEYSWSLDKRKLGGAFSRLARNYLDQLYPQMDLEQSIDALERDLKIIDRRDGVVAQKPLEELRDRLAGLKFDLQRVNTVLARQDGQESVPGWRKIIETADASAMIDDADVADVVAYARKIRTDFVRSHQNLPEQNLPTLSRQKDGSLTLDAEWQALDSAIKGTLEQPFFVEAAGKSPPQVISYERNHTVAFYLQGSRMQAALEHYKNYQRFVEIELDSLRLSASNKKNMQSLLRDAVLVAMWECLTGTDNMARDDDIPGTNVAMADALAQAFNNLERQDLAELVLNKETREAVVAMRKDYVKLRERSLYQFRRNDFSGWDGARGAAQTAFFASPEIDLRQYLSLQVRYVEAMLGHAEQRFEWLKLMKNRLSAQDRAFLVSLEQTQVELRKHAEQNPANTVTALENLILHTFDSMDRYTCRELLGKVELPVGSDFFSERAVALHGQATAQCSRFQAQADEAYQDELRGYFSRYLAGRFPFSADTAAPDADLRHVAGLLRLLETAKQRSRPLNPDWQTFFDRLEAASPLLRAVVESDGQGVDLDIAWRTSRAYEKEADQIIDWRLSAGTQYNAYPIKTETPLRWRPGQSVELSLRWASGSLSRPLLDSTQPALTVSGTTARWRHHGNWALLRLLIEHRQYMASNTKDMPELMFRVPVQRAGTGKDETAQVFLRIGLLPPGAKQALPLVSLPFVSP